MIDLLREISNTLFYISYQALIIFFNCKLIQLFRFVKFISYLLPWIELFMFFLYFLKYFLG